MKNLEKKYEEAIDNIKEKLFGLYKKSFEQNTDIQKLVTDVESCDNFDHIKANDINGVDYIYQLDDYVDFEEFDDMRKEALVEYLEGFCMTINEESMEVSTSTAEDIFIDWRRETVHYSPTNTAYYFNSEFQAFVWANLQCEENGIFGGFFDYDSYDGSVSESDIFIKFEKFWDLTKIQKPKIIKEILQHILENDLDYEGATLHVIQNYLNK